MSNILEYLPVVQSALDQQVLQQSTSGWMEANSGQVIYIGGNEIKVPTLTMDGLGDYDRENGVYPQGGVNLSYQTYPMTQDRGKQFFFDRHDVDETNFIVQATTIATEFQKNWVIPEIDAYRYATIASKAIAAGSGSSISETITKDNIITRINAEVAKIMDVTGLESDNLVITMSFLTKALFDEAMLTKGAVQLMDFARGAIFTKVSSLNGIPIVPVSSARMKTAFLFKTGTPDFGFVPAVGAKDINWLITPRSLPIAVSKTDNMKVFSPDVNQTGDGWRMQYRKYHELWIPKNRMERMFASIAV